MKYWCPNFWWKLVVQLSDWYSEGWKDDNNVTLEETRPRQLTWDNDAFDSFWKHQKKYKSDRYSQYQYLVKNFILKEIFCNIWSDKMHQPLKASKYVDLITSFMLISRNNFLRSDNPCYSSRCSIRDETKLSD